MKKFKYKNILLILILLYISGIFISQQFTMNKIKKQIEECKVEEKKAKEKNQKLQDEVKMSKSDAYVEKLARERLGLIKKGEIPVINSSNR